MGLNLPINVRFNNWWSMTPVSVSNTTDETILTTVTIPAGTLGTNGVIQGIIWGKVTSVLTPPALTLKLKYDDTSLTIMDAVTVADSLTDSPFRVEFEIVAVNDTAVQIMAATLQERIKAVDTAVNIFALDMTEDSSVAKAITLTATFGTAVADTSITCLGRRFWKLQES